MRILLAEDDATLRNLLSSMLKKWDYDVVAVENGEEAITVMSQPDPPRLALLDWSMPIINGVEVCTLIKTRLQQNLGTYTHIIMLTHHDSPSSLAAALDAGANDFIKKPAEPLELRARLEVGKRLIEYESSLLAKVKDERLALCRTMAELAESRDNASPRHMRRVAAYAACIADRCNLAEDFVEGIRTYAGFHDLGKLGVSQEILLAPRKLSLEEFEQVKLHPVLGYRILSAIPDMFLAAEICHTHHEKWDGTGYPRQLGNVEIPLAGRIVGLAEYYDALRMRRHYREPWSHDAVMRAVSDESEKHFDPAMVDALFNAEEEIMEIAEEEEREGGEYL